MKSAVAPPQITTNENVEPPKAQRLQGKLPLLEDIMQLARIGEIGPMQRMFEEGKAAVDYKDDEGITPLHVGAVPRPATWSQL